MLPASQPFASMKRADTLSVSKPSPPSKLLPENVTTVPTKAMMSICSSSFPPPSDTVLPVIVNTPVPSDPLAARSEPRPTNPPSPPTDW